MIAAMIICDKGSITIGGALDSVIRYLYLILILSIITKK